jgi:hypothetical protein
MRTMAIGGLGLLGSAAAGVLGMFTGSALAPVAWSAAAWLATVGVAVAYRRVAGNSHRPPAAAALAVLGIVASAWTVQTVLRITVPVALGSGIGLALWAYALRRARFVPPLPGAVIGVAAVIGALTNDPGMPYVLGGLPLGLTHLVAALPLEGKTIVRTVYRILAYVVVVEVAVQASLIALAVAGLGHWIDNGHMLDKSVMESNQTPFPEVLGFILHSINGGMIIPGIALLLLILSFFAKVPGGAKWAAIVFLLVIVQVMLGYTLHDLPSLGALHGLNALLLFAAALHAGNRARRPAISKTSDVDERVTTAA